VNFVVARHAESELNARDVLNGDASVAVPLTPLGREQARALGREAGPVDVVAHTAFGRTRETAELAWPDAPRLEVPELNEIAYGRFEGTVWGDGYGDWCATAGPCDPSPGGGESRVDAVRRYNRAWRLLLARPEPTVLVVAHGLVVRYVLDALEGRAPKPRADGVPCAEPFPVEADRLEAAVQVLERWLEAPRW
jgi:broad specificity phosphatase PhoE